MGFKNLFRKKDITNAGRFAELIRPDTWRIALVRNLTLRDLTSLGIAAVIGAGIFSTIGNASAAGGPAVSLLFIFTAIACAFSALLRPVCFYYSGCRQRLYLCLYLFWRTHCLDYRLGFINGICHW